MYSSFEASRTEFVRNKSYYYLVVMSDIEYQTIRASVIIKKVHLSVRFPCSLLFQLKNCISYSNIESTTAEGKGSYELKLGQC